MLITENIAKAKAFLRVTLKAESNTHFSIAS